MKSHRIIYVTGLGDRNLKNRELLLKLWWPHRAHIELCTMRWTVDEPWAKKLDRLTTLIRKRLDKGQKITLIGESAGAAATIQALRQEPRVSSVILLCGKSHHFDRVATAVFDINPAFKPALRGSEKIVNNLTTAEKQKILNLHPLFDHRTNPIDVPRINLHTNQYTSRCLATSIKLLVLVLH